MHVAALTIYPVKSLGAVAVERARMEAEGLAGDRRLMLVDADGTFLTQREEPRLAVLRAHLDAGSLRITGPGLSVDAGRRDGGRVAVSIWGAAADAATVGAAADAALSAWLGRPVRLVALDAATRRRSNPDWAPDAPVSFADGFPALVATAASLDDLNGRILERGGTAVPMARFRPNIVVAGADPWAEDGWATIRVGEVVLDLPKPCQRCVITTTDQDTGERPDDEPLATLTKFRRSRDPRIRGVLFAQNAVPRGTGTIAVGDEVEVIETRAPWPIG